MSDSETELQQKSGLIRKVETQINEDRVFKDLTTLQTSRLKQIDSLLDDLLTADEDEQKQAKALLLELLADEPRAPASRYLLGLFEIHLNGEDTEGYLKSLLEDVSSLSRWKIVEHIADKVLELEPENRIALRSKVTAVEQQQGKKATKPYLKKLATIDTNNPDVQKSYALSILEEDESEAIPLLKSAIESYARQKDYRNVDGIWNILVARDYEDLPFFEKIERIVVGDREKTRMAGYLLSLVEPHRKEENWDTVIRLLKKVLEYEPGSSRARSDLVRAYRNLYANHSLLDEFLKLSELTNHKKSPGPCIAEFERNIVFDKDNYVYHRTRGVGKIKLIDHEQMIVDFRKNPDQRMSLQMAISSLRPLAPEHIWVRLYENPDEVHEYFQSDISLFFELLLSSFGKKMVLAEIKQEIVGIFLELPQWSKWWSKTRTQLKKDPKFGFNPRKKDELILRENPITLSEELTLKFQSTTDWDKKMDVALQILKEQDTGSALQTAIQFYKENESNKEPLRQLHSFLYLEMASKVLQDDISGRLLKPALIRENLQKLPAEVLVAYSSTTAQIELKKEIVNLIMENRKDYAEILKAILFEVPMKINKYVLSELVKREKTDTLKAFVKEALAHYRDYPDVFLWTARNYLTDAWDYEWIVEEHTKENILLQVFRLLKPLASIEAKGTKLKNSAIETIFGTTSQTVEDMKQNETLLEIIENADVSVLRRMTALFRDVPYITDTHKQNFHELLSTLREDFTMDSGREEDVQDEADSAESLFPAEGVILVTAEALESRRSYYDNLVNVEMPANSRDIGEAQEKGDLRENAEYKAAMERQTQLRAEITKVGEELKRAREIDAKNVRTDVVTIGTKVRLQSSDGTLEYTILGPWDADSDNHIISYESPLGKALIGKKVAETASLDNKKTFTIETIERAI